MIKLQAINAGYEHNCLENISFELMNNEVSLLLGTNGAGKTCLLHTIAGVLKPKAGKVDGVHSKLELRATDLSYCYQSPLQNSLILVGDYLKHIHPLDKQRLEQLIELFSLAPLMSKPVAKLSGGEKQRVKLVSCLAQDSRTMLLDEPTTALDPFFVDQLIVAIHFLKNQDVSLLIASHDLLFAIKVGDRFIGLKDRRLVFDTTIEGLRNDNHLNNLFNKKFEWLETKQGGVVIC